MIKMGCQYEDCLYDATYFNVCITHKTKATCSVCDCIKRIVNNGVCIDHGAIRKICYHDGCTKLVINKNACRTHGAIVYTCSTDSCTNVAKKKTGLCKKHEGFTYNLKS